MRQTDQPKVNITELRKRYEASYLIPYELWSGPAHEPARPTTRALPELSVKENQFKK